MVGALFATADVYEVEEGMGQAEGSSKSLELVGVINDAASLEFRSQALKVEHNVDNDVPV